METLNAMKRGGHLGVALLLILFLFAVVRVNYNVQSYSNVIYLTDNPVRKKMRPLGEIFSGVVVVQELDATLKIDSEAVKSKEPCIDLMLATYGNRENVGRVQISLNIDDSIYEKVLSVKRVKDNSYHTVCFDKAHLDDLISANKVRLQLEGIDSPRGKAVTAWTTASSKLGRVFDNKGRVDLNRSLLYRIGYISEVSNERRFDVAFFSIVCLLAMFLFCWPLLTNQSIAQRR